MRRVTPARAGEGAGDARIVFSARCEGERGARACQVLTRLSNINSCRLSFRGFRESHPNANEDVGYGRAQLFREIYKWV